MSARSRRPSSTPPTRRVSRSRRARTMRSTSPTTRRGATRRSTTRTSTSSSRNDTGRWLLLRTFVGSSALTVKLYGTPQNRRVESETGAARGHRPAGASSASRTDACGSGPRSPRTRASRRARRASPAGSTPRIRKAALETHVVVLVPLRAGGSSATGRSRARSRRPPPPKEGEGATPAAAASPAGRRRRLHLAPAAASAALASTSQSGTRVGRKRDRVDAGVPVQPSAIVSPSRSTTYS